MLESLNPVASCKKYGVSIWQCPQFLFVIIGLVIIIAIVITYFLAVFRIGDPTIVSLLVLSVGAFSLALNFIITNSFERMAEVSKLKSEFIHIVSHQLRAPLTNINFTLDFLTSTKMVPTKEEQVEYQEILRENSLRMGDLIDNLLTVARIESGDFPLIKNKVSLEDIAQKLIVKFKPYSIASNIKLMLLVADHSLVVLADPLWVEQVMENFVDNAIKYTKGGGEVKIKIFRRNTAVFFEVQDDGVGIPPREQKLIFEKFFRSANALKKQTEGTGLGLHIAKKIIEKLGGKIGFSSKENKGSTFWFCLPIQKNG
ncbi:MAG: HAMP domain-containing sensor histidine kinase [Candidatus Pacebacteria bacterium]|nr:HAMP domain-containing sensor histidine kinase [Candidatus Paceibacterota bacterium]